MKTNCQDCGCSVYDGVCVNCHEETVILEQYIELEMDAPSKAFLAKVEQQKEQIEANKKNCKYLKAIN